MITEYKFKFGNRGFTLVELLVTISIIAILAVVGLTVFNGLQKNARDARRKSDIESISKAMETNYDEQLGQYKALAITHFAAGAIPVDPQTGASGNPCNGAVCKYCSRAGGVVGACGAEPTVAAGVPGAGSTYSVCANLETPVNGISYFCRANQR